MLSLSRFLILYTFLVSHFFSELIFLIKEAS